MSLLLMELRYPLRSSHLIDNLLSNGLGSPGPFAFRGLNLKLSVGRDRFSFFSNTTSNNQQIRAVYLDFKDMYALVYYIA